MARGGAAAVLLLPFLFVIDSSFGNDSTVGSIAATRRKAGSSFSFSFGDLVGRKVQESSTMTEEVFCSNLKDVEDFLLYEVERLFGGLPEMKSDGYNCECITEEAWLLDIQCSLTYVDYSESAERIFINSERLVLEANVGGELVPIKSEWCEKVVESEDDPYLSHCENFQFCEGNEYEAICSCGGYCDVCTVCPGFKSVTFGCDANSTFLALDNNQYTCEDEYSGSFFNGWIFTDIVPTITTTKTTNKSGAGASTAISSLVTAAIAIVFVVQLCDY